MATSPDFLMSSAIACLCKGGNFHVKQILPVIHYSHRTSGMGLDKPQR